jgi:hypothetical protein
VVAAPQQKNFATALRQVFNRLAYDRGQLAASVEVLGGGAAGQRVSAHAYDPPVGHAPVSQVLQRPVLRRDEQVRAREADAVVSAARSPKIEEEIVNDVLRRIG